MSITKLCAKTYLTQIPVGEVNLGLEKALAFVKRCNDVFVLGILLTNNPFLWSDYEETFEQSLKRRIVELNTAQLPTIKDNFFQLAVRYGICVDYKIPEKVELLEAMKVLIKTYTEETCPDFVRYFLMFHTEEHDPYDEFDQELMAFAERLSQNKDIPVADASPESCG